MEIEQLTKLVMTRDRKRIEKSLQEFGYEDASKNKKYRDFPITEIVKGFFYSTGWVPDELQAKEYEGRIFSDVNGAENAEFIVLSVNKIDKKKNLSLPLSLKFFVKEYKENER